MKCEIKFNQNPLGVYHAGETVSGTATIIFDKSRKISSIKLKVIGSATCEWTEKEKYKEGHKYHSRNVLYKGREDYMETNSDLMAYTGELFKVMPGIHSFDFSCLLPQCLPSSFEGGVGHIRYYVNVLIWQKVGKKEPVSFINAFTVIKRSDLNNFIYPVGDPIKLEEIKSFGCGPCRSDPLMFTITLPYSGFVPGQTIPLAIRIDNNSQATVYSFALKLQQMIKYISQVPHQATKLEERIIVREKLNQGATKGEHKTISHEIMIPALPPTNIALCSIIQITYVLKIKPRVSGTSKKDFNMELPITIGTMPLTHSLDSAAQIENVPAATHVPAVTHMPAATVIVASAPDLAHASDSDDAISADPTTLPPPSYEQAVGFGNAGFVPDHNTETTEGGHFAPLYPVYGFKAASAPPTTPDATVFKN